MIQFSYQFSAGLPAGSRRRGLYKYTRRHFGRGHSLLKALPNGVVQRELLHYAVQRPELGLGHAAAVVGTLPQLGGKKRQTKNNEYECHVDVLVGG